MAMSKIVWSRMALMRTHILGLRSQLSAVGARNMSGGFEEAQKNLQSLKEDPGNQMKLQLYALYKQATVGKVNTKKPGMLDIVGKAKWDAWNTLGDLSSEEARLKYASTVAELVKAEQGESAQADSAQGVGKYSTLAVTLEGGMRVIKLNRPNKKNSITEQMYDEWCAALDEAGKDDATSIAVLTGAGDYYCSGNDLSNFTKVTDLSPASIQKMAEGASVRLNKYVSAFIDFPKPLVAVVNGPAVGIAVTTLGLCDLVYATDKASFHTPFSALGQSPEACSSYTFPNIMGPAKASELLCFNRKITAQEACDWGLVTEVFPEGTFQQEVWPRLKQYAKFPKKSMMVAKELSRGPLRKSLHKVNEQECEFLVERWQSQDCMNAIQAFFSRKK